MCWLAPGVDGTWNVEKLTRDLPQTAQSNLAYFNEQAPLL